MTVTITKGAAAVKAKADVKAKGKTKGTAADALVSGYAELKLTFDAEMAKLAPLMKRVEEAEQALLAHVDESVPAAEGVELRSGEYVVRVGPRGDKVTSMDKKLIRKELGEKAFFELATFGVGDLKKYLPGNVLEKALTYEPVNKRKVTIKKAESDEA
jgi:hypothetical protein